MNEYHRALRELGAELGVELRLGYIGNCSPRNDDRLWDVCAMTTPVPTHETEGRGPWSHRASGNSYPCTASWTTEHFPTVDEVTEMVRKRLAREAGR